MDIALVGLIAQSDDVKPFDLQSRNCLSLACSAHTWRSMKARFGYQNIHISTILPSIRKSVLL
jgi:hypothetical protein